MFTTEKKITDLPSKEQQLNFSRAKMKIKEKEYLFSMFSQKIKTTIEPYAQQNIHQA